jgi:hypothetical protein
LKSIDTQGNIPATTTTEIIQQAFNAARKEVKPFVRATSNIVNGQLDQFRTEAKAKLTAGPKNIGYGITPAKSNVTETQLSKMQANLNLAPQSARKTEILASVKKPLSNEVLEATNGYANISDEQRTAIYKKMQVTEQVAIARKTVFTKMKSLYGSSFNISESDYNKLSAAEIVDMNKAISTGLRTGALSISKEIKKHMTPLQAALAQKGWTEFE